MNRSRTTKIRRPRVKDISRSLVFRLPAEIDPARITARPTLYGTVLLGNTRVIECIAAEARELLMVAHGSCPTAVDRITEALRATGLEPT
jgi:hypothetical protein